MEKWIIILLGVAVLAAVFLSPFASTKPDGLERVAEDKGFLERGEGSQVVNSPIPDYAVPGIKNEKLATAIAGLVGVIIVAALGFALGAILKRKEKIQ
ncbi:MAG: PDGLE domain-containing protein [bacterium]